MHNLYSSMPHGMAWHGTAWHGTAWHGMAQHGRLSDQLTFCTKTLETVQEDVVSFSSHSRLILVLFSSKPKPQALFRYFQSLNDVAGLLLVQQELSPSLYFLFLPSFSFAKSWTEYVQHTDTFVILYLLASNYSKSIKYRDFCHSMLNFSAFHGVFRLLRKKHQF